MMNLYVLARVIYTVLRGLYKTANALITAYAVLLLKQHILYHDKKSVCSCMIKTAYAEISLKQPNVSTEKPHIDYLRDKASVLY